MSTPTRSTLFDVTIILRTALQDYLVPEEEYNSVEFDAIFGRMTVAELVQEILGRLATTPAAIQPAGEAAPDAGTEVTGYQQPNGLEQFAADYQRRKAAPIEAGELPPLPASAKMTIGELQHEPYFDADQMRAQYTDGYTVGHADGYASCARRDTKPESVTGGAVSDRHGRMTDALRDAIMGMSVSIDVSTGENDSGNRLFGVVNEVMDCDGDKHGVTLLVYDTEANFTAPTVDAVSDNVSALTVEEILAIGKEVGAIEQKDSPYFLPVTFARAIESRVQGKASDAEDAAYVVGQRVGILEGASIIREAYVNHSFHTGLKGLEDRCKEAEQVLLNKADAARAQQQGDTA